jgi:hypothetical protein
MQKEQRKNLFAALSLARAVGACVTSYPSSDIVSAASSPSNEQYGHLLMRNVKRELRILSRADAACDITLQPELDVSGMRAQAKTADGTVFFVSVNGRPFVFKWAGSEGPNAEFEPDAEPFVESVVSNATSAVRLCGRVPFFTATYCTFGCRLKKSSISRSKRGAREPFYDLSPGLFSRPSPGSSWIGMASLQEYVPYDLKCALSMCGLDVVQHAALMTMIIAALYFTNEVLMVNHNDLHLANIRFAPTPGGRLFLRWNGRWRVIACPLYPMLIDWGRACEYVADGLCSSNSKYFFHREGRPVSKNADLSNIVSRMVIPISEKWMPASERNPDKLSIFSNALRIMSGSRVPANGVSVQELGASICMLNLFVCCSTEFGGSSGSYAPPTSMFEVRDGHVNLDSDMYLNYVLSGTPSMDRRPLRMAQSRMFMDTFVKLWPETKTPSPDLLQAIIS